MFGRRGRTPTETTKVGEFELRVEVLHAGTRSEGRVGRLFRGDHEVVGSHPGETITATPDGPTLVFLGDDRPHLWSTSGWTLSDE